MMATAKTIADENNGCNSQQKPKPKSTTKNIYPSISKGNREDQSNFKISTDNCRSTEFADEN